MRASFQKIARLDAHHRLFIAFSVGVATGVGLLFCPLTGAERATGAWLAYALTVLALAWTAILTIHPREIPQISRLEDSSRVLILAFVAAAAVASLGAVMQLLKGDAVPLSRVLLAAATVVSSWLLVHTVFTLRYAHLFYGDYGGKSQRGSGSGGLDFPGEKTPDYLDFAYFAFIIGMTSQTADVGIRSRAIRRVALAHGLLSFLFNTSIIALSINTLSSML